MTQEEAIEILKINVEDGLTCGNLKFAEALDMAIKALEQEPKVGRCKDCKWWKDKDGVYRRGISAESKCPINRIEVMEGIGYCFMFESQESEG